jgi:hypothetical protein
MKTHHKTAAVLLHFPISGRKGDVICTSVTNLDIHDIARSCRTYEIDHYYIVTPLIEQKAIVDQLLEYWHQPTNQQWHPDRFEALSRVQVVADFEAVKTDLNTRYSGAVLEVAMPDARPMPNQLSYHEIREKWSHEAAQGVKIVVFGTGWGVAPEFYPEVHTYLAPIYGPLAKNGYNHLSVRSAVAIILDRLFGIT